MHVLGFVSEGLVPGTLEHPREQSPGIGQLCSVQGCESGPGWTLALVGLLSLRRADLSAADCRSQAQNDLIWNVKDELKKACSTNDLKELLIFNKQQVPSGESAVSCPCVTGAASQAARPCAVTVPVECGRPSG